MTRFDTAPPTLAWGLPVVFTLIAVTAGLGLRDPWAPDEPRFALVAQEMVESGQWLFPHVAGVLYPDKPPLFFWLVAAAYLATGSLRVALLVPAALAALVVVWLTGDLARRLHGAGAGFAAAMALAVTIQFTAHGRSGQIDGFLLGLTTLSLYGLLRHLLLGPAWSWWRVGWLAAGLGVITKGVGFLPLLVLIPWALLPRRPLAGRFRDWGSGPLMMLAVIAAWLGPMLVAAGGGPALAAYRDNILLRQTAVRYVSPWHHFKHPLYFAVNVIPFHWMPLTLVLPWLLNRWRDSWRSRDSRVLLPLAWCLLVVLFFSLSPGKRGLYILPALPAFVLAAAPYLREIAGRVVVQKLLRWVLAGFGLVLTAIAVVLRWFPPERAARLLEENPGDPFGYLAVGATILLAAAWAGRRWRAIPAWVGATLLMWAGWGWWALPAVNQVRSAAPLMTAVESHLPPDAELGLVNWKEQFVLHAMRPVTHFGYRRQDRLEEYREALTWAALAPARRLLVPADQPGFALAADNDARLLGSRHRQTWWLVAASDVEWCRQARHPDPVERTP